MFDVIKILDFKKLGKQTLLNKLISSEPKQIMCLEKKKKNKRTETRNGPTMPLTSNLKISYLFVFFFFGFLCASLFCYLSSR